MYFLKFLIYSIFIRELFTVYEVGVNDEDKKGHIGVRPGFTQ